MSTPSNALKLSDCAIDLDEARRVIDRLEAQRRTLESEVAAAKKELLAIKLPEHDRCETCNTELGPFGPLNSDGEPREDCIVCILGDKLAEARATIQKQGIDNLAWISEVGELKAQLARLSEPNQPKGDWQV